MWYHLAASLFSQWQVPSAEEKEALCLPACMESPQQLCEVICKTRGRQNTSIGSDSLDSSLGSAHSLTCYMTWRLSDHDSDKKVMPKSWCCCKGPPTVLHIAEWYQLVPIQIVTPRWHTCWCRFKITWLWLTPCSCTGLPPSFHKPCNHATPHEIGLGLMTSSLSLSLPGMVVIIVLIA